MRRNNFIYFGGLAFSTLLPIPLMFAALVINVSGASFLLGMVAGGVAFIGGVISARA